MNIGREAKFTISSLALAALLTGCGKVAPEDYPPALAQYSGCIADSAATNGISEGNLIATAMTESSGNPYAVSSANARGLMQITDSASQDIERLTGMSGCHYETDPCKQIECGARYKRILRDFFHRDSNSAYYAGSKGGTNENYEAAVNRNKPPSFLDKLIASVFTGGLYTIKSGDTLTSIAQSNGTTVDALKSLNGLSSDTIYAGKKIKIPRANNTNSSDKQALVDKDSVTVRVQSDENLLIIANRYGVTLNALMIRNGIVNADYVQAGAVLIIP
jgi:LysM repeat protein